MSSEHILPDSRLAHNPMHGSVLVDWQMPDGSSVRVECAKVYCANCGAEYGFVPLENTTFTCWLCNQCFEQYGAIANTYAVPEDDFNRAVVYEMEQRYGRHLTDLELFKELEQGRLGTALEKLEKESPYRVWRQES